MRWPGFRDDDALVLPLDPARFLPPGSPLRLRLDGHVLERKHEVHLTLLGRDAGRAMRGRLGEERIRGLFESMEWAPQGTARYALLHKAKPQWEGTLQAWSVIEHVQSRRSPRSAMSWHRPAGWRWTAACRTPRFTSPAIPTASACRTSPPTAAVSCAKWRLRSWRRASGSPTDPSGHCATPLCR